MSSKHMMKWVCDRCKVAELTNGEWDDECGGYTYDKPNNWTKFRQNDLCDSCTNYLNEITRKFMEEEGLFDIVKDK